eukprot:gene24822-31207_t
MASFLSPSKCEGFPEIARIANFSENSDTVDKAFAALPAEIRSILEKLIITVDPKNIEDFRNVSDEDSSFLKGVVSEHFVVQEDDQNHVKSLYIPYFEGTIGTTVKYTYSELMAFVDKPEFKYLHQWESDDMLLWDNTKFMHRAMGETVGKRLLWRTQVFSALQEVATPNCRIHWRYWTIPWRDILIQMFKEVHRDVSMDFDFATIDSLPKALHFPGHCIIPKGLCFESQGCR